MHQLFPCLEKKIGEDFSSFSCEGKHMMQSFLFISVKLLVRDSILHCMRLKKILFLLYSTAINRMCRLR